MINCPKCYYLLNIAAFFHIIANLHVLIKSIHPNAIVGCGDFTMDISLYKSKLYKCLVGLERHEDEKIMTKFSCLDELTLHFC